MESELEDEFFELEGCQYGVCCHNKKYKNLLKEIKELRVIIKRYQDKLNEKRTFTCECCNTKNEVSIYDYKEDIDGTFGNDNLVVNCLHCGCLFNVLDKNTVEIIKNNIERNYEYK